MIIFFSYKTKPAFSKEFLSFLKSYKSYFLNSIFKNIKINIKPTFNQIQIISYVVLLFPRII